MPEGDTLERVALRLGPALVGGVLTEIEAPRWPGLLPKAGESVVSVRAVGKWLRVDFSGGLVLLSHLRMNGQWHLYRPGERWRRGRGAMRARLANDRWEAVCFSAPIVEFHSAASADRRLGHLGPDLTGPTPDLDACVSALGTLEPTTTVAEALLDQRVAAGIGNVYKSEVCWFERLDPFTPLAAIDPPLRLRLFDRAHRLLRANLGPGRRRTVAGGLAVYGRTGKPCRRCGAAIRSAVHTEHARRTYWCPGCQFVPGHGHQGTLGPDSPDQAIGK